MVLRPVLCFSVTSQYYAHPSHLFCTVQKLKCRKYLNHWLTTLATHSSSVCCSELTWAPQELDCYLYRHITCQKVSHQFLGNLSLQRQLNRLWKNLHSGQSSQNCSLTFCIMRIWQLYIKWTVVLTSSLRDGQYKWTWEHRRWIFLVHKKCILGLGW